MRVGQFELKPKLAQALLLVLAIAGLCATSVVSAQGSEKSKKVLILFTHQSDQAGQAIVEQAMRSTLQAGSSEPLEIYSEYLDAVRVPLAGHEKETVGQLQRKYAAENFDLIFAVNPPALKLLLENRSVFFPDAPIVFLVLDEQNLSGIGNASNMTGVWGEVNYKSNLELALALHPGTKQVFVISGVGEWDNYWRSLVQEELRPLEGRVEFSYLTGLTVSELKTTTAALPPQTIVLFVSSTQDREGNNPGNLVVIREVAPASSAPLYGSSDAQLGLGIVGGTLLSFEALGAEGAWVGLRVIAGEKPEAIPPHEISSVPMFDWRQLQRWGISEASLPAGSVVRFKQLSVWEQYKWYVIGLLALLILETLLIALLVYLRFRRRQAEAETARLSGRITEIVSNVPGIVWESRTDPVMGGRRTTFISDYVERMLGYTPEEWFNQPPGFGFERVVEEDRERARRESQAVINTGQEGISEFRWQTKDGDIRWVENYLSPLIDDNSQVVGLRGVALDVTNRKLAEEHARQAEEKDKAILSAIPDLMFIQDLDGFYLDYHATDPKSLFAPPETFLGKNFRDVLPPDLAERFSERLERAEEGGGPQVLEYRLNISDEDRWYEARIVRAGDKILSMVRDITDRVRALDELLRSEERFGKAFRANPQPMSITRISDGRYIDINDSFLSVSGYTREEVIGRTTMDLGVWKTPEARAEFIAAVSKNGSVANFETEFLTKNGTSRRLLTSAERLEIGGEDCLLVASTDITERKAAENALRESESYNRAILSSLNSHVCVLDRNGRIVSVNHSWVAFARDNGLTSSTSVGPGANYLDVCRKAATEGDKLASPAMVGLKEVCDGTREYFSLEYPCHSPTVKRWFLMIVTPLRGEEGGAVVVHNDITEIKLAAEAVRESEERFRKMADDAPMMIWVSGIDKLCTYFNKEWLDFRGRTMEQELGDQWVEGVHPDDRAHCLEVYVSSFDQRKKFEMEYRLQRSDGEFRWVFDHGTARFTPEGKFVGYIGTAFDITERRTAERELRQAHDELNALKNQLEAENIYLQEELRQDQAFGDIVGQSAAIKHLLFKISQVAPTDSTVLVMGETGTGKELVARAIHERSLRKDRPLIKVNCAALSASLIESELFGHERGAFTGAEARKPGRFEVANSGTILLDEIGELPLDLQGKLLRVLQEGEFERVGGSKTIKTDVRIIASTNRDLKKAAERGTFREDLWYRLNVFPITTPPLRDRRDDIPLLTEHFASIFSRRLGKKVTAVSPETLSELCEYSWPGNVRELANVLERAVINLRGTVLKIHEDFRILEADVLAASVKTLDDMERDHITRVLEDLNWRIDGPGGAARILGINPSTLRSRMIKLGIDKPNGRPSPASEKR